MLRLLNEKRTVMPPLVYYDDLRIDRVLECDDSTLSFSIPIKLRPKELKVENYIQTKTEEYVIKSIEISDDTVTVLADINIDELEGTFFEEFATTEKTAEECARLALAGTGWQVECGSQKKRTIKATNKYVWDIIKQIANTYRLELKIDSLNKKLTFVEHRGIDKGIYFSDQLNLKRIDKKTDTQDFYTRLIPIGKDGLTIESVNGGKRYLENYQYSKKVKTYYWKDERYTIPESLKEDGEAKLNDLSKPYNAYSCDIVDLANAGDKKYEILSYGIGDTVTLLNNATETREKQRIVKLTEYPEEPKRNTCELANVILSFEEYSSKYEDAAETVNNITADGGTVDGDRIDNIDAAKVLRLEEVIAASAKFVEVETNILNVTQQLNAANAKIGTLETTKLTATEADIKYATIENLTAATGRIDTLETNALTAGSALIHSLTSDVSKINTLMFGTASGGSLTTEFSNTVVGLIGDAQIKSAMIADVTADKITSGRLYTNLVEVCSQSGNLDIADNTILIRDSGNTARVQIGKDAAGDYNIYIWDKDGRLMFDPLYGVQEEGIKRAIIRNDMVSENANISAKKLDISSLFAEINGSTETITSSRIFVDADNQTLDVSFKNMSTAVQTATTKADNVYNLASSANTNASSALAQVNTITETVYTQGTQLATVQGQISSKVWQQDITTAVTELEIGGRNYLLKSNVENTMQSPATGYTQLEYKSVLPEKLQLANGTDKYTISLWLKPLKEKQPFTCIILGGLENGDAWAMRANLASFVVENISGTDIKKYSYTFTPPENCYMQSFIKFILESRDNAACTVYRVKLEKGSKATDWTPAPEDIDSSISAIEGTTTTLSNQYTSLNQSLTSLTATVNSNTTAITEKADGSMVTSLQSTITELQADLTGFKTTVSDSYTTKTEFNNLQIGGRNLLLGTQTQDKTKGNFQQSVTDTGQTYKGCKVFKSSLQYADIGFWFNTQIRDRKVVAAGDWVTYSIYARTDDTVNRALKVFLQGNTGNYVYDKLPTENPGFLTDKWQRYSYTIQITEEMLGTTGNYATIWRFECITTTTTGTYIYWAAPKLEIGKKATDYSAAPEDTDSKFADYATTTALNSAIDQKASSILATVSGTYATQSSLGNYATTQSVTASLALKIDKTDNNQIVSMINASADVIRLTANRFILDSTYSKINQDGTVMFTGGNIGGFQIDGNGLFSVQNNVGCGMQKFGQGSAFWAGAGGVGNGGQNAEFKVWHDGSVFAQKLYVTGGEVAGWNIGNNALYKDNGDYRTYIQVPTNNDTWVFSCQKRKSGNTYRGAWYVTADGVQHSDTIYINAEDGTGIKLLGAAGQEVLINRDDITLWYRSLSEADDYSRWTQVGKGYVRINTAGTDYMEDAALSVMGGDVYVEKTFYYWAYAANNGEGGFLSLRDYINGVIDGTI